MSESSKTVRQSFRLDEETLNLLDEYAERNRLSRNAAANEILYLSLSSGLQNGTDILADRIADKALDKWEEQYGAILRNTRNTERFIDKNVEILIELMDALFAYEGYSGITESRTRSYTLARKRVEDRIAANKQKADSRK